MAAERNDANREGGISEMHRKRRGRNIAMLVVLASLVVLFYVITIVKMGGSH